MELYRKYPKYISLACCCVLACIVFIQSIPLLPTHNLRVYFLNVGQGDAVLIVTPNGNTLLYDAGPPGDALVRELDHILPRGMRTLDAVVLSHPDADHIGGLTGLTSRYSIRRYIDTAYFHPSALFADTQEYLEKISYERFRVRSESYLALGGGVYITLIQMEMDGADANNGSIAMHVRYGNSSILCTGDMDSHTEEYLVSRYGKQLQGNVLKAGHHGAKTSNSERLLRAASSTYVVISAGENNSYGHPHVPALARMAYVGATPIETAKEGTILFSCDWNRCTQKSSQ
jgi:competence protein ComEC